ncbi:Hypp1300 [Branchiostoma lanceolatum]|uniref:Hypp1300 protein n=1 Tax=Branchiostoma lanceolatum TaxID=7740 RepID=A0A8K0EME6_BRALA|nr:Hypp1300 [Branchiostoma lanceolatum]
MQQSNLSSNQTTRVASYPTVELQFMQTLPSDVPIDHIPGTDTNVAEYVYENDDVDENVSANDKDDEQVYANDEDDDEHVYANDEDDDEHVYANDEDDDEHVYANDEDEHANQDMNEPDESANPPSDGGPVPGAPVRPFLSSPQWVCVAITASAAVALLLTGLLITGPTESRQQNLPYPTSRIGI